MTTMTPREVIAFALSLDLCLVPDERAGDIESALSAAGFVIVPREPPAKWSREHRNRWRAFLSAMIAAAEEKPDAA